MKTEEQVWRVIVDANPVPDVNVFGRERLGDTANLANLEQRSSDMTRMDTKAEGAEDSKRPIGRWLVAAVLAIVAGVAVILFSQNNTGPVADQPSPSSVDEAASPGEALLTSYATAVNSGDIDDVMSHYATDDFIVVKRHPYALNDYMDRVSAVRDTEASISDYVGSGAGLEIFDMVAGDPDSVTQPDVTFSWTFNFGADGTEATGWFWSGDDSPQVSSAETNCIGGSDGRVFMNDGKISEINWGFEDPTKCDD